MTREQWDNRYLAMAQMVASWSKDPRTKCGSVIVRPNGTVLSIGYNGLPRGIADTPERLNNRELKLQLMVHAEENAILNSSERPVGCTLYVWPLLSCPRCAVKLIQAGVKRVVAPASDRKTCANMDMTLTPKLFAEAGVKLVLT